MEMWQLEEHQPSWSVHNTLDSSFHHELCFPGPETWTGTEKFEFSSFHSISEDSSEFNTSTPFLSSIFHGESSLEPCLADLEDSGIDEVDRFFNWPESDDVSPSQGSTTEESVDVSSIQSPLVFPVEDMEIDDEVSIPPLLKACGEAMENRNKELVEVILKRLENKACPQGGAAQRLVYYMIKSLDQHFDYLTQEASKNYEAAFRVFYQIFPYGRFAHFIATSSILEALPEDAEQICIVDFDMGEGVQWPPLIEALAKQRQRVTRIISLKSGDSKSVHPLQRFEKTKERLREHAFSCGLELRIEEIDLEGLASEMKKMTKFGGREFLAFNCMVGLPHMGRQKSSRHVSKFLKIAQESINTGDGTRNRGVITYGDGTTMEERRSDGYGFGSFFEGQLGRVKALLESMEWQKPSQHKEARIAMECLFAAPYVSSLSCFEKWEERDCRGEHLAKIGLDARRVSKDIVSEAKELVRDGDSWYRVGTEEEKENQAVLCFKGTPLVRVSIWS
ncbi:hypothetical protein Vadar_007095 [Vaccinium darrowii]|uniref:Uncharacterized protein n=1 Tax=Vaccinium darrowii TaxID=229202 RepID=A0ACB7ZA05_9ERIC|nr:hypothetical protein Vadar_007095 [Vaccinium darrowii]